MKQWIECEKPVTVKNNYRDVQRVHIRRDAGKIFNWLYDATDLDIEQKTPSMIQNKSFLLFVYSNIILVVLNISLEQCLASWA